MTIKKIATRILLMAVVLAMALPLCAFTVVIDAGHGGKDAGALGDNTNEKTVNLRVALRLADLIRKNMADAKVVLTRSDDNFVTLQGRADIANKARGDIFISIHANSVAKESPSRRSVSGASVYTLGLDKMDANMEIARRENAVITMESDYRSTYNGFDPNSTESYILLEMDRAANMDQSISLARNIQRQLTSLAGRKDNGVRQAPFYVLVRTTMPAVLVELDFICNPVQEQFMASADGQSRLATAIYNGIAAYRGRRSIASAAPAPAAPAAPSPAAVPAAPAADGKTLFHVQFLTSGSSVIPAGDPRFKGLDNVSHYTDADGIVKYITAPMTSQSDASRELARVKKLFPQAFIIRMRDGRRLK